MKTKRRLTLAATLWLITFFSAAQQTLPELEILTSSNVSRMVELYALLDENVRMTEIAFNPTLPILAYVSDQHLVLWDYEEQQTQWEIILEQRQSGNGLAFNTAGTQMVASINFGLYLWRVDSRTPQAEFRNPITTGGGNVGYTGDARFSRDGSQVIAARSSFAGVSRWDINSQELLFDDLFSDFGYAHDDSAVNNSILSDDGRNIFMVGQVSSTVEIRETGRGVVLNRLRLDEQLGIVPDDFFNNYALDVSGDNRYMVLSVNLRQNNTPLNQIVWLSVGGEVLRQVEHDHGVIRAGQLSPDEQLLALGNRDNGDVYVWDATTGEALVTLHGHTDRINSLAFSPDGTLLASASDDGTVRLWGVPYD